MSTNNNELNKVVIFGCNDYAQLAHYYLSEDGFYNVIGFAVDKEFIPPEEKFCGLPVWDFNTSAFFEGALFFAPMSPKKMNCQRQRVYERIKQRGFKMINYISQNATVLSFDIGENCFILENNVIQPFTKIGNNVVLWSGNHIGHHSTIEDHVTVTSHCVVSGHCTIGANSFLGVNSTIRDGLKIGKGTLVGAAANVIKNTEEWRGYVGNPALKIEGKQSINLL